MKINNIKLAKLFDCCRVVGNNALALCQQSEKWPKNAVCGELSTRLEYKNLVCAIEA
ncbi:MAG: helix-turn-helix domain-containing protein [Spirulinaceae cyanobacterium]